MKRPRKPPRPHRVNPHDSRYSGRIRSSGYARGHGSVPKNAQKTINLGSFWAILKVNSDGSYNTVDISEINGVYHARERFRQEHPEITNFLMAREDRVYNDEGYSIEAHDGNHILLHNLRDGAWHSEKDLTGRLALPSNTVFDEDWERKWLKKAKIGDSTWLMNRGFVNQVGTNKQSRQYRITPLGRVALEVLNKHRTEGVRVMPTSTPWEK